VHVVVAVCVCIIVVTSIVVFVITVVGVVCRMINILVQVTIVVRRITCSIVDVGHTIKYGAIESVDVTDAVIVVEVIVDLTNIHSANVRVDQSSADVWVVDIVGVVVNVTVKGAGSGVFRTIALTDVQVSVDVGVSIHVHIVVGVSVHVHVV
jgi:hypothetical protein